LSNHLPGLFGFPSHPHTNLSNKSPHQSPHVVTRNHHIDLYALVEGKNQSNHAETCPYKEKGTRHRMTEIYPPTESTEDHEKYYEPGFYEIRVEGHLDARWAASFGGLTFTLKENGDTVLAGRVADQAALHGLLRKVRDLGIPLLSVIRIKPGQADG
jgi:hypothetical protein